MADNDFAGLAYLKNAKLVTAGFTLQMNTYDLYADQELKPSDDVNCITLLSSGEYEANVARPACGAVPGRPINWGRLGFVTVAMPAFFKTGACKLQACHLIFTNEKVEALVEAPVSWAFDNLTDYLNIGDRAVLASMRRLRREALSPGTAHKKMVEAIGDSIVIDLHRRFSARVGGATRRRSMLAGWQSRRIEDYVRARLADGPIPVTTLAGLCGISASHLSRSFRNTTGTTLTSYIERIRMDAARAQLTDRTLTMAQVAIACGYAHSSNFAATFRRVFGETPSGFRKR